MSTLSIKSAQIVKFIYKLEIVNLIDLVNTFGYSDVILSLIELEGLELISINKDNQINMTENGKLWIKSNKNVLYLTPKYRYWRTVPTEEIINEIGINEPFLPKNKFLGRYFKD